MLANVHFDAIGYSVAKHLLVQMSYNDIYVHILVRNVLHVRNVANASCVPIIYRNIQKRMKFHLQHHLCHHHHHSQLQ